MFGEQLNMFWDNLPHGPKTLDVGIIFPSNIFLKDSCFPDFARILRNCCPNCCPNNCFICPNAARIDARIAARVDALVARIVARIDARIVARIDARIVARIYFSLARNSLGQILATAG